MSLETTRKWGVFIETIRSILQKRGYFEVQTPTILKCPSTEPYLDFFCLESGFLASSPEYSHKKLLAEGIGSLFEIRTCFRRELSGPWHREEFFLLEWYEVGLGYERFPIRVAQFFSDVENCYSQKVESDIPSKLSSNWNFFSMKDLFARQFLFELTPCTHEKDLKALCLKMSPNQNFDDWTWDELFYFLFVGYIEPKLSRYHRVIIYDYPPQLAALAEIADNGWAQRIEVYIDGLEVANGYQELQDLEVYRRRFNEDNERRKQLGKVQVLWDREFEEALRKGWPKPTCGIAIGLERWFAKILGLPDIHSWSPLWRRR